MRHFAASGLRLWSLSREAKIIYTFFCVLSFLALLSSVLLYEDLVGPSLRAGRLLRVRQYYGGEAASLGAPEPGRAPDPQGTAPEIALPDEAAQGTLTLTVAMPYRKLLEVTHFHLFTVPVFLLIISHLFMLTGMSSSSKLLWILCGWSSGTLHILAPWLIRYGGGGWSFAYPLSGTALLVSASLMTSAPVVAMWRRKAPARAIAGAPRSTTDVGEG